LAKFIQNRKITQAKKFVFSV
jgi:hypothetical protein